LSRKGVNGRVVKAGPNLTICSRSCPALDGNRFRKYFWLTWMIQNRLLAICGIHIYPIAEKQKMELLAETPRTPDAES
ncbi:hypothetical protein, partial [Aeromonas veronii]|uniref:hypothetical protein n=1 Tax=Aeromonas veronii TaxID=654 RepID=UPI003005307C